MTAWLTPPEGGAAGIAEALASCLPQLETERLILRAPRLADWPLLESIWRGDRAAHIGGPMNGEDAYLDFAQCVGSWMLRGSGALTITLKADDRPLGLVLIAAEWGDPALELGWLLTAEAEGHGYATEAARAMRDWGFGTLGLNRLSSFIAQGNEGSVRVAERLGARRVGAVPGYDDCDLYLHERETTR